MNLENEVKEKIYMPDKSFKTFSIHVMKFQSLPLTEI